MITIKNLKKYYDRSSCTSYYESTYICNKETNNYHLTCLWLNEDGKIIREISTFKKKANFEHNIVYNANKANECKNKIYINENVISFITKWSIGTLHGYLDIFVCIFCYLKDFDKLKSYKILVYKNANQGILDIINHLCHINVIDKSKIIYIEPDKVYKIKSVNIYRSYKREDYWPNDKFNEDIRMLISKYFINKIDYLNPINYFIENVAIIKDSSGPSVSGKNDGFNKNDINLFCKKYNYTLVRPEDTNEVTLINILNNCKNFAASWGTASLKNTVYLSENRKSINILVHKNSRYLLEYKKYLIEYKKYLKSNKTNERSETLKNFYDPPTVKYHLIDDIKNIVL